MAARRPRSGVDHEPTGVGSVDTGARAGRDAARRAERRGGRASGNRPILWPIGLRVAFIAGISALLWLIVIGLILIVRG